MHENIIVSANQRQSCSDACWSYWFAMKTSSDESATMSRMPTPASQENAAVQGAVRSGAIQIAFLLFLFLNCVYLATSTGRVRSIDEVDPVLQSESLLLRHSTAIPQAVNSGIWFGKRDRNGIPRSAWPFGHGFLVLPWSALGHYVLAQLPGMPRAISDLAISTAICWSNATFAALAVAGCFLISLKLGVNVRNAMACSLLLAFCTPLFVYSGWLFSEPVSAAIFVIAALLLFAEDGILSAPRVSAGALLLAFSIHVRPANGVIGAIFILAALLLDHSANRQGFRYRTTIILIVAVGVSGALYLLRNYELFGSPFDFGVPTMAENGKDLDSWHNPFWRGVFGFVFSPGKSAFLFCPPILLGIAGVPRLWRRHRPLCVIAVLAPLSSLVLYSFRTQWEGSYCYGPRYLLPGLVLLILPIGTLFRDPPRWLRPVFWCTATIGFLVQAIGLATNIMEDMVRNHYYVGNWDYRMSYSPITGQLRLIWKYLHQAPTAFGLGWDRWFVFLRSAGANAALVDGIEAFFLLGAVLFGWMTWKSLRSYRASIGTGMEETGGF
jgi:hypothetical protein